MTTYVEFQRVSFMIIELISVAQPGAWGRSHPPSPTSEKKEIDKRHKKEKEKDKR